MITKAILELPQFIITAEGVLDDVSDWTVTCVRGDGLPINTWKIENLFFDSRELDNFVWDSAKALLSGSYSITYEETE